MSYNVESGKYRSIYELLEDLMKHISEKSNMPFFNSDQHANYMLIDPQSQEQIKSIDKLKHGYKFQLVHVRDYRKRDCKKTKKQNEENDDSTDNEEDAFDCEDTPFMASSKESLLNAISGTSSDPNPQPYGATLVPNGTS